jgi:hypothetical protein
MHSLGRGEVICTANLQTNCAHTQASTHTSMVLGLLKGRLSWGKNNGNITVYQLGSPLSWKITKWHLLAAPVVSWVRKHCAGPVTSAAGSVNVGMPSHRKMTASEEKAIDKRFHFLPYETEKHSCNNLDRLQSRLVRWCGWTVWQAVLINVSKAPMASKATWPPRPVARELQQRQGLKQGT